jgi:catechol 2,3-dioxygenase-like lactoylglutathione lyase family enzyme
MIRTRGLTHVALTVADVDRSVRFYHEVFGAVEVYRTADMTQLQTPGAWDVLVLQQGTVPTPRSGGIAHIGFRLVDPADIAVAAADVVRAGGTIVSQGEFVPGEPYLFAQDPDGYDLEIWYEIPTPVDPPLSRVEPGPPSTATTG